MINHILVQLPVMCRDYNKAAVLETKKNTCEFQENFT